jgi:hypothetical protein
MAERYYKGDDFDAFDQEWAEIELDIPEEWDISRAEFKVGNLPVMVFTEPTFPMSVNLASYQTAGLKDVSTCYIALYDRQGRKQTLNGSWTFVTKEKVV